MKSSKPKKFLKNNSIKKINGLIIPPFLTSQTTASTTHKNTLNHATFATILLRK